MTQTPEEKLIEEFVNTILPNALEMGVTGKKVITQELLTAFARIREDERKKSFGRALYLVAQHDPQTGYDVNPAYWGQTLRKALIEEEVSAAKLLSALTPRK